MNGIALVQNDELCDALHKIASSCNSNPFPPTADGIPSHGIYFVFDSAEPGHGGLRIVRVGSHTGNGNLSSRLREHVTVNKDRSIFRKHVGRAVLARDSDPYLATWNIDFTTRANRERYGHLIDREKQKRIEDEVSAYIVDHLSFRVIGTPNPQVALQFERLSIATVACCKKCQASAQWLGMFSPIDKVRTTGLWQTQHLRGDVLSEDLLADLKKHAARHA
jgi:hypothetical protein